MASILLPLIHGFTLSGDLSQDVPEFLLKHGCPKTAEHTGVVVREAEGIARRFGVDAQQTAAAGWLHDVSAVIPAAERLEAAHALGIEVLPAEAVYPLILHQKLSAVLAREIFGMTDAGILSAIGCHTTLKPSPSPLDLVVFIADKLAWDQPGEAPFHPAMRAALDWSLDAAALAYLDYLWQNRSALKVIHPWTEAARADLSLR